MAFFNESYLGTPPWDIGRPQREFARLAMHSEIRGTVLDVGCGTGENAIFFAKHGHEVWGVDAAPLAIEKATRKAKESGARVNFLVADALHLEKLKRRFNTITDCGLFHVFSDEARRVFERSLRSALEPDGTYFMLCFSDKEPAGWGGPRRVSEDEIRETFHEGWKINYIREASFESSFHSDGGRAWLTSINSV
ncbi:MAG: class I SAM-dependent methyltransferase [Thaumarchaeota archaeon]|nr:class I SAM-dependent methyltransferase [Nitrososphaerota archaeon]